MIEVSVISFVFFVFGICIGSFLNVCIVRWPYEKSVVKPRSQCVSCYKPIAWYDNIPLISYILLGGKCRYCKEKFSMRYFIVELITGITFVLFYLYYGLDVLLAPYLFMMCCFIIATFVDFAHRIIPDEVSVGGMCFGLAFSLLIPQLHSLDPSQGNRILIHLHSFGLSLLGLLVGGGSIYAMGVLGDFLFKKESMGGGDVKLLAMIGSFLGWKVSILAFFIAPFFGALFGLIEKVRTNDTTIAYGPFLVLGALIALFWEHEIIGYILGLYGLN